MCLKHFAVPRVSLAVPSATRVKGELVSAFRPRRVRSYSSNDVRRARRHSPFRLVTAHSFAILDKSGLEGKLLEFEAGRLRVDGVGPMSAGRQRRRDPRQSVSERWHAR